MSIFLYPGCITQVNDKDYVSVEGLKYFFSGLVSSRVFAGKRTNILENKHSKFINWFMKFDFSKIVFKGLKFDTSSTCKFCQFVGYDHKIQGKFLTCTCDCVRRPMYKFSNAY